MSFLQMRATREYTACERQEERKRERGLRDARETVLVSEPLIKHPDNVVNRKLPFICTEKMKAKYVQLVVHRHLNVSPSKCISTVCSHPFCLQNHIVSEI